MTLHKAAKAQILFLLASDDLWQITALKHELEHSRLRYYFLLLSDRTLLALLISNHFAEYAGRLPIVLVINYTFAGKNCTILLDLVQRVKTFAAVECLVTNPPYLEKEREELIELGARLFYGEYVPEARKVKVN